MSALEWLKSQGYSMSATMGGSWGTQLADPLESFCVTAWKGEEFHRAGTYREIAERLGWIDERAVKGETQE